MNHFDPGEGWREASDDEAADGRETVQHFDGARGWTNWVRAESLPLLPTEPWTVIRVTWRTEPVLGSVLLLDGDNLCWRDDEGGIAPPDLTDSITSFEVLAELREHSIDAVLSAAGGWLTTKQRAQICIELGVEPR